jgi:glycosyltransferase involved in cell wall biosynthesis
MPEPLISVFILTKNEEANLFKALKSVMGWAHRVFVVDSGSTDGSERITREMGAEFVPHAWEGFARQRNWALANLPFETPWVFILDADEQVEPELRDEMLKIAKEDKCPENGFNVNRRVYFMGKWIKHCGFYPSWNVRLIRGGKGKYTDRAVHEHMEVDGAVGYLKGEMIHEDQRGLHHFIFKHNEYSTLEAGEMYKAELDPSSLPKVRLFGGGSVERRRWIKHYLWPKLPCRWLVRFFVMYFLKLGVLDGLTGLRFCVMLTIYEYEISLKLIEMRRKSAMKI